MTDVNWLLSALAQTAGALVAIIGGFLVSRLVGMSAQRNGLLTRLDEIGKQVESAEMSLLDARKELVAWELNLLIPCFIDDLAQRDGDLNNYSLDN